MGYKIIFCRKEKHRNLFTGYGAAIGMNPFFLFSFFLQKLFPSDGGEQLLIDNFAKPPYFLLIRGLYQIYVS